MKQKTGVEHLPIMISILKQAATKEHRRDRRAARGKHGRPEQCGSRRGAVRKWRWRAGLRECGSARQEVRSGRRGAEVVLRGKGKTENWGLGFFLNTLTKPR